MKSESESHSVVSDSLWSHGTLQDRILEWVTFPFSRGSSQSRDQPRSPTLQVGSLPAELQRKPKTTTVDSLSLLQEIFRTQESNWGLLRCRRILYRLSYEEKKVKRVILQAWPLLRLPDVYTWKIGSLVPQPPSLQTSAENLQRFLANCVHDCED